MNIHTQYQAQVFDQSYQKKPAIAGVEIVELRLQSDDGGNFSELVRMNQGMVQGLQEPFEAKQSSMSVLVPGAIKAFHLHYDQDDLWYVMPSDRIIVNLHDVRQDSPTFDLHMRVVLGGGKNLLLRIPKGVAHGGANMYERNMVLFYFTNQQFNMNAPDEHRLPWDAFGTDIWRVTEG